MKYFTHYFILKHHKMKKLDLINFLDEYLKIDQYEDSSKNGLQVDNEKKEIKKI
jgi:putative NIF3 family GTP cyclohydrolase 1 type 2